MLYSATGNDRLLITERISSKTGLNAFPRKMEEKTEPRTHEQFLSNLPSDEQHLTETNK